MSRSPTSPDDFASRLEHVLTERGMSGRRLAARLDVDKATVSRWRRREFHPRHATILSIAEALDIPVSSLMVEGAEALVDGGAPVEPGRTGSLDRDAAALLERLAECGRVLGALEVLEELAPDLIGVLRDVQAYAQRAGTSPLPRATVDD
jgi:transcriptional regulator with XRE-family HTH domain